MSQTNAEGSSFEPNNQSTANESQQQQRAATNSNATEQCNLGPEPTKPLGTVPAPSIPQPVDVDAAMRRFQERLSGHFAGQPLPSGPPPPAMDHTARTTQPPPERLSVEEIVKSIPKLGYLPQVEPLPPVKVLGLPNVTTPAPVKLEELHTLEVKVREGQARARMGTVGVDMTYQLIGVRQDKRWIDNKVGRVLTPSVVPIRYAMAPAATSESTGGYKINLASAAAALGSRTLDETYHRAIQALKGFFPASGQQDVIDGPARLVIANLNEQLITPHRYVYRMVQMYLAAKYCEQRGAALAPFMGGGDQRCVEPIHVQALATYSHHLTYLNGANVVYFHAQYNPQVMSEMLAVYCVAAVADAGLDATDSTVILPGAYTEFPPIGYCPVYYSGASITALHYSQLTSAAIRFALFDWCHSHGCLNLAEEYMRTIPTLAYSDSPDSAPVFQTPRLTVTLPGLELGPAILLPISDQYSKSLESRPVLDVPYHDTEYRGAALSQVMGVLYRRALHAAALGLTLYSNRHKDELNQAVRDTWPVGNISPCMHYVRQGLKDMGLTGELGAFLSGISPDLNNISELKAFYTNAKAAYCFEEVMPIVECLVPNTAMAAALNPVRSKISPKLGIPYTAEALEGTTSSECMFNVAMHSGIAFYKTITDTMLGHQTRVHYRPVHNYRGALSDWQFEERVFRKRAQIAYNFQLLSAHAAISLHVGPFGEHNPQWFWDYNRVEHKASQQVDNSWFAPFDPAQDYPAFTGSKVHGDSYGKPLSGPQPRTKRSARPELSGTQGIQYSQLIEMAEELSTIFNDADIHGGCENLEVLGMLDYLVGRIPDPYTGDGSGRGQMHSTAAMESFIKALGEDDPTLMLLGVPDWQRAAAAAKMAEFCNALISHERARSYQWQLYQAAARFQDYAATLSYEGSVEVAERMKKRFDDLPPPPTRVTRVTTKRMPAAGIAKQPPPAAQATTDAQQPPPPPPPPLPRTSPFHEDLQGEIRAMETKMERKHAEAAAAMQRQVATLTQSMDTMAGLIGTLVSRGGMPPAAAKVVQQAAGLPPAQPPAQQQPPAVPPVSMSVPPSGSIAAALTGKETDLQVALVDGTSIADFKRAVTGAGAATTTKPADFGKTVSTTSSAPAQSVVTRPTPTPSTSKAADTVKTFPLTAVEKAAGVVIPHSVEDLTARLNQAHLDLRTLSVNTLALVGPPATRSLYARGVAEFKHMKTRALMEAAKPHAARDVAGRMTNMMDAVARLSTEKEAAQTRAGLAHREAEELVAYVAAYKIYQVEPTIHLLAASSTVDTSVLPMYCTVIFPGGATVVVRPATPPPSPSARAVWFYAATGNNPAQIQSLVGQVEERVVEVEGPPGVLRSKEALELVQRKHPATKKESAVVTKQSGTAHRAPKPKSALLADFIEEPPAPDVMRGSVPRLPHSATKVDPKGSGKRGKRSRKPPPLAFAPEETASLGPWGEATPLLRNAMMAWVGAVARDTLPAQLDAAIGLTEEGARWPIVSNLRAIMSQPPPPPPSRQADIVKYAAAKSAHANERQLAGHQLREVLSQQAMESAAFRAWTNRRLPKEQMPGEMKMALQQWADGSVDPANVTLQLDEDIVFVEETGPSHQGIPPEMVPPGDDGAAPGGDNPPVISVNKFAAAFQQMRSRSTSEVSIQSQPDSESDAPSEHSHTSSPPRSHSSVGDEESTAFQSMASENGGSVASLLGDLVQRTVDAQPSSSTSMPTFVAAGLSGIRSHSPTSNGSPLSADEIVTAVNRAARTTASRSPTPTLRYEHVAIISEPEDLVASFGAFANASDQQQPPNQPVDTQPPPTAGTSTPPPAQHFTLAASMSPSSVHSAVEEVAHGNPPAVLEMEPTAKP